MKKQRYYFLVTADEYELPMFVETSWARLARASHISSSTLRLAYARGCVVKKRYKVEVVNF